MAQKPRLPVSTAGMQSSIVSYSQSQLNASVPWLETAHHRESPYMPAWLVPTSRQSVATTAATVQFDGKDFHARQCTAATVRKANVRPAGLPRNRNKYQPKTAK